MIALVLCPAVHAQPLATRLIGTWIIDVDQTMTNIQADSQWQMQMQYYDADEKVKFLNDFREFLSLIRMTFRDDQKVILKDETEETLADYRILSSDTNTLKVNIKENQNMEETVEIVFTDQDHLRVTSETDNQSKHFLWVRSQ
jgi:hypothetical protein